MNVNTQDMERNIQVNTFTKNTNADRIPTKKYSTKVKE